MNKYTTLSAKITKEDREELRKLGINPTEIIRKAIHDEIKRARDNELMEKMKKVAPVLSKLKMDELVKDIREDRER
ncbi:hypothetical protein [Ferroplasma acidarmanus]|jgi:hypothetical protein|uniref:CopG family transcriptional regulator n=1 Tax=Ferroplasma acidarmanus Fer1 TaxID=333146 RepID=S0AKZ3_FERAC|nr:hypothetical protein [Ferroplasma acidarmanus]AGO60033.1 hypothetical protein FACI_IFERC00001G0053 [Ferroplasma acidarmanus Fer1]HIH59749.1 CopG family transcriptional regulator [Ferroplasma sp.]